MAGPGRRGPAPKDPKIRQRSNDDGRDWVYLPNVPYAGPRPETPDSLDHPRALGWWETVSSMPHCKLWGPPQWVRALTVAHLWQDFWREYDSGVVHASKVNALLKAEADLATTRPEQMKQGIVLVDDVETVAEPAPDPTTPTEHPTDPRAFLRAV